ncbi:MAG: hypothetical protein WBG36_15425 [Ornithinimicrobium sp.]
MLVILVDPPKAGQGPFPCRASGESLTDGRIYLRVEGETREAKSEEVGLLVQRGAAGAQGDVDFAIEVIGEIATVTFDSATTVDRYLARMRKLLLAALPRKQASSATAPAAHRSLADLSGYASKFDNLSALRGAMTEPEGRTEEEYTESIDHWEGHFRAAWQAAMPKIAVSQSQPTVIRIRNRTTTFLHDVEVKLHLEGGVFAFDYTKPEWAQTFSDLDLPEPPRKWGPTQRSFGLPNYAHIGHLSTPNLSQYIPPSISYKNGGSVKLDLEVGELRPRGTYESEDEAIVLLVSDRSLTSIHGTWELTARDHNEVYTGEMDVAVGGDRDLSARARRILGLKEGDAEGETAE